MSKVLCVFGGSGEGGVHSSLSESHILQIVAASLAGTAVLYAAGRFLLTSSSPAELEVELVETGGAQGVELNSVRPKIGKYNVEGFSSLGGLNIVCERLMQLVEIPLVYPLLASELKIRPPSGILLKGPPGCGKTALVQSLAAETGVRLVTLYSAEVKRPHYGDTEKKIRRFFQKALEFAPSILLIDEIDALGRKRGGHQGDQSALSQLLTLMDQLSKQEQVVVVIATTNQPDALDMALRRPGRLEQELQIQHPDESGRHEILQIHSRGVDLDKSVKLDLVARDTPGFSGADLSAICKEAELICRNECLQSCQSELKQSVSKKQKESIIRQALSGRQVKQKHFQVAIDNFENPSALRDIAVEVPDTCWDDIGGLENIKDKLQQLVQYPIEYPEIFNKFGRKPSKGILLFGPPGCGKTLLARAVARECSANFISIKGPELQSKWHGQSAANVRWVFSKAQQVAPCVLFFDEIDSIAVERVGADASSGSRAGDSMLTQLLVELDGVQSRTNSADVRQTVFVIAATNRPEIIDRAMLRPGRLDELILIPLPDNTSRKQVFTACLRKTPLAGDINFDDLSTRTEGFSSADIYEGNISLQIEYLPSSRFSKRVPSQTLSAKKKRKKVKPYPEQFDAKNRTGKQQQPQRVSISTLRNRQQPKQFGTGQMVASLLTWLFSRVGYSKKNQQMQDYRVWGGGLKQIREIQKFPGIGMSSSIVRWQHLVQQVQKCEECGKFNAEKSMVGNTESQTSVTTHVGSKHNQQLTVDSGQPVDPVPCVTKDHFELVLKGVRKSVPEGYFKRYVEMEKQLREQGCFDVVSEVPDGMYL